MPSILSYLKVFIGVVTFAGTIPMTKWALLDFSAFEIATARVFVGGLLAASYLLTTKKFHYVSQYKGFAAGTFVGVGLYPFLISLSLVGLPATYSSVALGILPLVTGLMAISIFKEKVSGSYYVFAFLGTLAVVVYSFNPELKSPLYLIVLAAAILVAATGYAFGGKFAGYVGGATAISCALTLFLPLSTVAFILTWWGKKILLSQGSQSLVALAYVAVLAQWLGFFPFFSGLSEIGTAKGIQIQLLQPFVGLVLVSLMIREETLVIYDFVIVGVVLVCIYFSNRSRLK